MPCRSYEDDDNNWREDRLREQNDRLARIACKAMTLLEELGKEDFLLLEDKEIRDWWTEHKIADAKAAAAKAAIEYKSMRGVSCEKCGKGTYGETSIHDDWDGIFHCDKCNHATESSVEIK